MLTNYSYYTSCHRSVLEGGGDVALLIVNKLTFYYFLFLSTYSNLIAERYTSLLLSSSDTMLTALLVAL